MATNSNKKACCYFKSKTHKHIVKIETLLNLYDSLINQIEMARSDLNDFPSGATSASLEPYFKDTFTAKLEATKAETEKRLERLSNMRDNVEKLLNKSLKMEVDYYDRNFKF